MVAESGPPASSKEWVTERQDVADDYKKLFGKIHFNELKAIAIISNSDDTQTESEGYIKRIWIESAHPQKIHKNRLMIPADIRKDARHVLHALRLLAEKPATVLKETGANSVNTVRKLRLPKK